MTTPEPDPDFLPDSNILPTDPTVPVPTHPRVIAPRN
jgi:hypothetical protein